jgi:hypothetical protein
MVKGKNKEQFEKWYMETYKFFVVDLPNSKNGKETTVDINFNSFYRLPFEMQIGVYLAYYDSLGIIIERQTYNGFMVIWDYRIEEPDEEFKIDCCYLENQNQWYQEAFKKADQLINKK